MNDQRNEKGEAPIALAPGSLTVCEGDRLVLVLRSVVWGEANVQDLIDSLKKIGLGGRFVILYLDAEDEAHVVRGAA